MRAWVVIAYICVNGLLSLPMVSIMGRMAEMGNTAGVYVVTGGIVFFSVSTGVVALLLLGRAPRG